MLYYFDEENYLNYIFLVFVFWLQSASAHLGSGSTFLRVNENFAQNKFLYLGQITLSLPLDLATNPYLVNKPVTFSVDISSLGKQTFMPPGFFNNVQWRWSYATGYNFDQGNGEYQYGDKMTYAFTTPRSYNA